MQAGLSAIAIVPPSRSRPVETRPVDVDVDVDVDVVPDGSDGVPEATVVAETTGVPETYETRPGSCPSPSDDDEFHPR
eukprot:scaffold14410_cov60-Phaeocystis_antarctica.AAC.11